MQERKFDAPPASRAGRDRRGFSNVMRSSYIIDDGTLLERPSGITSAHNWDKVRFIEGSTVEVYCSRKLSVLRDSLPRVYHYLQEYSLK